MTTHPVELKRAMKLVGGEAVFDQQAERYRLDSEYVEENMPKLLSKYGEKWIAVYNREVQTSSAHMEVVLKDLRKKNLSEGEAVITFLTTQEMVTLF